MLGQIMDGSMFSVARQALSGLSRRQGAIASNVANVDTPGYARREVTFEDALRLQVDSSSSRLRTTDARHFTTALASAEANGSAGRTRDVVSERNDANNVNIDEEMLLLVDTQLRFQALSQTTGRRITTLRGVIRGG
ncbi:MAG: flagellar basal body rod protein FlgB [Dehalococcoidia bacterium]